MWRILQDLMWAMVRSTTWRIRLMLLLASSAASLSSPLGGLLVGCDHSLSYVSLVGDPPGGIHSLQQSGGVQGRHVVYGPRIRIGGPHEPSIEPDQDLDVHAGRPVLTATTIRGDSASSSRGRGCRPPRSRSPRAPPPR